MSLKEIPPISTLEKCERCVVTIRCTNEDYRECYIYEGYLIHVLNLGWHMRIDDDSITKIRYFQRKVQ